MDWSKTRVKPFSNFRCSKLNPQLAGYGPKLVDDDYRKVGERPWVAPHRSEEMRYQTEHQRSLGPRFPVKAITHADPATVPRSEKAAVLDPWNARRIQGQEMHATGADRERLIIWHDKLMLPNEHLPPIKQLNPSKWRTQYTKDFSADDRNICRKTRLVPDAGTMDKITSRPDYSCDVKPFMGKQLAEQFKPDAFNKFGCTKTHSQIVFG